MLADLVQLLHKHFGTSEQAKCFRTERRTHRRKPREDLQSLYDDICRLMSLTYPGPTTDLVNVVGRDAFLEAPGNPSLRVCLLDKVPVT